MFDTPKGFDIALALELLYTVSLAQSGAPKSSASAYTVRGSPLRDDQTKLLVARDGKSDTEVVTSVCESGDILVAFRPSETQFFAANGSLRDWFLTDLRSHRILYPPRPGDWPNHTWVHIGFWDAYDLVKLKLQAEVLRLMAVGPATEGRRLHVTGFSLGGALAPLAAMDLALLGLPTIMYSFAAPRPGDESLNKLLTSRVRASWVVGYGGDPVIHVPPIGPNFPLTLHATGTIEIGPITVGVISLPQIGQEYQTPDKVVYIGTDSVVKDHFPPGQLALSFGHHSPQVYQAALEHVAQWANVDPPKPGPKVDVSAMLHSMRS